MASRLLAARLVPVVVAVCLLSVAGCARTHFGCYDYAKCDAGIGGGGGTDAGGTAGSPGDGQAGSSVGAGGSAGSAPCNGTCSGSTPVCDTTSNTCVQCLASTDCAAPTPACDTGTHTCVACTANTDCTTPTPACDTTSHTCVECTANTDCPSAKPFCDMTAHGCVQCHSNTDCTDATASRCDAGVCKPCTADADCSQITGKTVCDTSSSTCVQCTGTDYSVCGTDSATSTPLVCDSLQHTCTANKEHSSGLCGGCVSDAHCPLGQMCVLETFGAPAQNVGYFCFWKQGDTANGAPADCFATGRPYAGTRTNAMSIDGTTADVCTLAVSTCVARNEFRSKSCTSLADTTTCGFDPPNDAKCAQVSVSSFACTMTCGSDFDCPNGFACNTLVNPSVCNLQ